MIGLWRNRHSATLLLPLFGDFAPLRGNACGDVADAVHAAKVKQRISS